MEENQYRDIYHSINPRRCVFEKTIQSRRCHCSQAHRFCLADREGVSCNTEAAQQRCRLLLDTLRGKAIFAMHLTRIEGALPHAKEVKIQNGGLLGLQLQIDPAHQPQHPITDIHRLLDQAVAQYQSLDNFPYDEIVKQIVHFAGRARRRDK